MNINSQLIEAAQSVRQATGIAMLRKAMHQDAGSVSALIEGMNNTNKAIEASVTPHKGTNIDVRI